MGLHRGRKRYDALPKLKPGAPVWWAPPACSGSRITVTPTITSCPPKPSPMMPQPNILLIHSDQHRFDCLGVNGHPFLRTPNLDRLAAQGVNFTHAFTPNPVCSPARACLQTGAWATTHKCVTIPNTEAFQCADPGLPVLTQLLAQAGYQVGHIGKYHQELQGEPTDHGADTYIGYDQYFAWRQRQGLQPRPGTHGWYGQTDPHIRPEQTSLAWQADQTLALLDRYAQNGRPFFLRWDPPEPHLPNVVPPPYDSMYPLDQIQPWPSFPDPLIHKPAVQRRTRRRWGTDAWSWQQWAPIVQRYLGEITLLDAQVGRLLDRLEQLGIGDQTLVVYTTDHGDMCGAHGMMDKHYVMYDDILRVPLVARWPGVLPAGQTCPAMIVHELDLARTFLAAAQVEAPPTFVGLDLRDPVAGRTSRPDVFAQYQGTGQGLYSQRMLRDRRYKYIYNPVAFDELYDLQTDPGELHNLVDDPAQQERLQALQIRMDAWMHQIHDRLSSPLFDWGRSKLPPTHPAHPRAGRAGPAPDTPQVRTE